MKTKELSFLHYDVVREHREYVSAYPYSAYMWAEQEGRTLDELLLRRLRKEHEFSFGTDVLEKFRRERCFLNRNIFLRKKMHKVCTQPCDLRNEAIVDGAYYPQLHKILDWVYNLPVKEQNKLINTPIKELVIAIPVSVYKTPFIVK
jgi:hypothetical protein